MLIEKAVELRNRYIEEIIEIRRFIHQNPETYFEEFRTKEYIINFLKKHNIEYIDDIYETAVIALVRGDKEGETIALRADMDALPIQEDTGLEFSSKVEGKMHACGHDIHTAALMGTILMINDNKTELHGNVKFIFQPAEEQGVDGGAKGLIKNGVLENPKVDAIFSTHVFPNIKFGQVSISDGEMMSGIDIIRLKIKGKGGHLSEPHNSINPIYPAAQFINMIANLRTQYVDPFEKVIIDVGVLHAGTRGNIIPQEATLVGNVRSYNDKLRFEIKDKMLNIVKSLELAYGVECEYDHIIGYSPVINDMEMARFYKESCETVFGKDNVINLKPVMGAEDFGEYLKYVPGAFSWIGVDLEGEQSYPLHHPKFSPTEDVIAKMMEMFFVTSCRYLNKSS